MNLQNQVLKISSMKSKMYLMLILILFKYLILDLSQNIVI